MIIDFQNICEVQNEFSIIKKQRVIGSNNKTKYRLLEPIKIKLSCGDIITIPEGFIWDGSSVPRFLWWLLPPEGDFEIAGLIHDYLYVNKRVFPYTRKFVDQEMFKWSKCVSGTSNKISLRNLDNYTRYFFVNLIGGLVWNDFVKIK